MNNLHKLEEVKWLDIKNLKPHPKNRNKHPADQINRLAQILRYQGFRKPIVISNRSGFIVEGHGRVEAARANGWSKVPVCFQDFEDDAQEYAHLIADNAIASWAELDMPAINIDTLELGPFDTDLLGIKGWEPIAEDKYSDKDADTIPEVAQNELGVKLGDIYQLGEHRLMCGDSTDLATVEKLMNGEKADMVFTDPPYGIDEETDRAYAAPSRVAKGNTFSKIIGDTSIETALKAYRICDSLSDVVCYWGGNYYAHELSPTPCWIVWDKRVEENQRDMNSDCELAYVKHPNKESVRIFRHLWKGMIKGSEHGEGRVHPTQKPIALAEWCFQELDTKGKTVLDLFGGSGSTLIACEKTNRKCFMMELDPHYCSVIIKRWEDFAGSKAKKLS